MTCGGDILKGKTRIESIKLNKESRINEPFRRARWYTSNKVVIAHYLYIKRFLSCLDNCLLQLQKDKDDEPQIILGNCYRPAVDHYSSFLLIKIATSGLSYLVEETLSVDLTFHLLSASFVRWSQYILANNAPTLTEVASFTKIHWVGANIVAFVRPHFSSTPGFHGSMTSDQMGDWLPKRCQVLTTLN